MRIVKLNIFRTLISRPGREPSSPHWCPAELVQYGWGHYNHYSQSSQSTHSSLVTNKVQPAPVCQPGQQTDQTDHQLPSSGEEAEEGAETPEAEKTDESLDPEMMVTLCESPHRFLATLDDDLSLDLPSVPM